MRWTIIVASNDGAQLEMLHEAAQAIRADLPPGNHMILDAESVEEVRRKRKRVADPSAELLIVAATLIDGDPTKITPDAGFRLVKEVQEQQGIRPACILLSDQLEHAAQVQLMERCEFLLLKNGMNCVAQCRQLALKLSASKPPEPQQPASEESPDAQAGAIDSQPGDSQSGRSHGYAWIDVMLRKTDPQMPHVDVTLELEVKPPGEEPFRPEPEHLHIDKQEVQDMLKKSRRLTDRLSRNLATDEAWKRAHRAWEARYRALGQQVFDLLAHRKFLRLYTIAETKVKAPNVRVRFTLQADMFDGLWEAAFDAERNRYLMLDGPIARRVEAPQSYDTFRMPSAGGNDLSVLFIKSSVPDSSIPDGPDDPRWQEYADDVGAYLGALPHLDDELNALLTLSNEIQAAPPHQRPVTTLSVDVLDESDAPEDSWSLAAQVEKTLREANGRYDIVHFAGHALFARSKRAKDDRGYLIFSGHPNPQAVPIAVVSEWLRAAGVQLVHLSCCRSSAARAATEFAHQGIPMTIGFTWDLEDRRAVDFTALFYRSLLTDGRLNVCDAFSSARHRLLRTFEMGNPIWASPVLVAQPWDRTQVEGMLRLPKRKRPLPRVRGGRLPKSGPPTPEAGLRS